MDGQTFDRFCVILSNLTPGNGPKWNPGVLRIYQVGLRDVPNEAASALTEAIIDGHDFRPSVAQIKELYRTITQGDRPSAHALTAEIMGLLAQYGAYGQRDTKYGAKHFYLLGPPAELSAEAAQVVAVWGGWVKFAEDPSPAGVQRGQLLKVAQGVVDGASSDVVRRLQLEYQASQPAALEQGAVMIEAPPQDYNRPATREEASNVMARMGRLLPAPERETAEA